MKTRSDTPKSVRREYRRMVMERSGIERVRMGSGMSDMMVAFATANLAARGYTGPRLRAELAMRLYRREMGAAERRRLYDHLLAVGVAALPGPRGAGVNSDE